MTRNDDDFAREIEAHVALEAERLVAEGHDFASARTAALKKFGNVTSARERFHESRRIMWLEDLRKDVALALRSTRRNPGFATAAIRTLALGIGEIGRASCREGGEGLSADGRRKEHGARER